MLRGSPIKHIQESGEEYWRSRARGLEAEVHALNEEVLFLGGKLERVDELEEKIEVLLAQNSHLVDENESLIRLVQQRKAEVEGWKARFEGEHSTLSAAEAERRRVFDHLSLKDQEHQVQLDRLLAEISRLQEEAASQEAMRQLEISALRNKLEAEALSQIQSLKRSQYGNAELQELSLKKLRGEVEAKEFEMENLRREARLDGERLQGEIGYLRNELAKLEAQRQHEAELLRAEHDNSKSSLLRAQRKSEEELRSLHEAKVRRLTYELEERRAEVEELQGRGRRSGKENEAELGNLLGEKTKLRLELKEQDNGSRERTAQLVGFY